ncbi:MAG: ATP-binding protein [Atribacterota bacterium]
MQKSIDEKRPLQGKIVEVLEHRLLLEEKKPRYTLKVSLPNSILSPETQEIVLQVITEALNNILKHAQAKQIWIKIGTWRDKMYLLIRDDGKGFAMQHLPPAHGLNFLKQQVVLKQGSLQVSSSPGQGTMIKVVLPIYG